MDPKDTETMSYLVRMVIPMKREFGRSLDVHQFLHDLPYATEVVQEALKSQDERLRSYGEYMQTKILGPRNSDQPAQKTSSTAKPVAPSAEATSQKEVEISEELRAKAIARYQSGLR